MGRALWRAQGEQTLLHEQGELRRLVHKLTLTRPCSTLPPPLMVRCRLGSESPLDGLSRFSSGAVASSHARRSVHGEQMPLAEYE